MACDVPVALEPLQTAHREAVIDLFNHYVEHGFAAYPESKVPYDFFDMFLELAERYPAVAARAEDGAVVGFALLRPFNPMPAFARTAEVTYFLAPDHIGLGLGSMLLNHLEREAKRLKIDSLLANISSLNKGSIAFHEKRGFVCCGRFVKVGRKFGRDFDQFWMQKRLA